MCSSQTFLFKRAAAIAFLTAGLVLGTPGTPAMADVWEWPLGGHPSVRNSFDPPSTLWGAGHRGVDLAAKRGEPVSASGAGRVLYAGMLAGRGVVSIVHGSLRTTYEPVLPSVRAGEHVRAGQRIGVVGQASTHCLPRVCLHWGLLRGNDYLDPLSLLGGGRVRLLPVWGVPRPYGLLMI